MEEEPLVSVTIPSYNSERMIPLCLEAVKRQTYPNIEILVIDSNSRDKTREGAAYGQISRFKRSSGPISAPFRHRSDLRRNLVLREVVRILVWQAIKDWPSGFFSPFNPKAFKIGYYLYQERR